MVEVVALAVLVGSAVAILGELALAVARWSVEPYDESVR